MQTLEEIRQIRLNREATITIGNFDGVHLGHQYLLGELVRRARATGRESVVLTFFPHPRTVLSPGTEIRYLSPLDQRIAQIEAIGVDRIVVVRFTPEVAQLSALEFCQLLVDHLHLRELILGEGATIGHDREGNPERLAEIGRELGFTVDVLSPLVIDGSRVSSSAIRQALKNGELSEANKLLGRPFRLQGIVVYGEARGAKIGFPTANIETDSEQLLPADGVYAVMAEVEGHRYPAVMNIGVRPSFGGATRTIEVHILDWQGDLYRKEMAVDLIRRLRPEQRFAGVDQLIAQIRNDVEQARAVLAG